VLQYHEQYKRCVLELNLAKFHFNVLQRQTVVAILCMSTFAYSLIADAVKVLYIFVVESSNTMLDIGMVYEPLILHYGRCRR
jgi:hypothetical protein